MMRKGIFVFKTSAGMFAIKKLTRKQGNTKDPNPKESIQWVNCFSKNGPLAHCETNIMTFINNKYKNTHGFC